MFPPKALLSMILITLTAVDANFLSRRTGGRDILTLATRINKGGTLTLVERDRTRAKLFQGHGPRTNSSPSFNDTNAVMFITAEVGIGSPANNYTVLIDTGSSNTWVGASKPYIKTSTSNDTGNAVRVIYGTSYFFGEEWVDTVTLSPDLVIEKQSIGVASQSNHISPLDGILGLGPVDRTDGSVTHARTIPTVSDNLLSQGKISEEVVGVYCIPVSEPTSNGAITFGGYDPSVITDSVKYVPLTKTSPSSESWGIDQSIHYGDTVILSTTAGIVDTGTTLILIASDAFQRYQFATGATFDYNTNHLTITPAQYSTLKTLSFNIGGTTYDLTPNAQIWPRSLNTAISGTSTAIYLIVNDIGSVSGSGLNFINGLTFLERYYSVFDTTHNRVGFASTAYTNADIN